MNAARAAHEAARGLRERMRAHDRAREGLMMVMLSEAPLRIGSVASLDLRSSFIGDLRCMIVNADDTKEKRDDVRPLSADLIAAISQYVALHRPVLAQPGETALFVDRWGKRASAEALTTAFGKGAFRVFKRRVNPHAIRTSVATWIVATAPQEAALASLILHHCDPRTTTAYNATANQFAASRTLGQATAATTRRLTPAVPQKRKTSASSTRPRSLRLELATRRGG